MIYFRAKFLVAFICLLLTSHAPATADTGTLISSQEGINVSIEVEPGFDKIFRPNIPLPVAVKVLNASDRTLEGRLSIVPKNWIPPANYFHNVSIEPYSHEVYEMFIYEGRNANAITIRLLDKQNDVIQQKEIDIQPRNIQQGNVVLVMSENPDDFMFLEQLSPSGFRRFQTANLHRNTVLRSDFNLSGIHIVKGVPSHLKSMLMSWETLNSVFCDLESYLNMEPELKSYLHTWIKLGGELLLYHSGAILDESAIEEINADEFLPFQIHGYAKFMPHETDSAYLFDLDNPVDILRAEYPSNHSQYKISEYEYPLISSAVSGAGGITLMHFQPSIISADEQFLWVEVFFQLSLFASTPHQFIIKDRFIQTVPYVATSAGNVPTKSEKYLKGVSGVFYGIALQFLIPIAVILLISAIFFKFNQTRLFILVIFPLLIAVLIFVPQVSKRTDLLPGRPVEIYNYLQMTSDDKPALLYQVMVMGKAFPETGVLKIGGMGEFSLFDEMVYTSRGPRPMLHVNNKPPGTLESLEKTIEVFRSIIAVTQTKNAGNIHGEVTVYPDGKIKYDIENNTNFTITNCKIYPIEYNIASKRPKRLPDMKPGEKISGFLTDEPDVVSFINESLYDYCLRYPNDIFSPESRREILYYMEGSITGSAYKTSKHPMLYSDEAIFFGWSSDFMKKVEIDNSMTTNKQVSCIIARIKIKWVDTEPTIVEYDIDAIIEDNLNLFSS